MRITRLVDWVTNTGENIIDNEGENLAFVEYGVSVNAPILYNCSSKKIVPHRVFTLYGVGFKGDMAIKAISSTGTEIIQLYPNNRDETSLDFISEYEFNDKFRVSVSYYEIIDNIIYYSNFSKEIYIYSHATIEHALNKYCPVYKKSSYLNALLNLFPNGIFAKNEDSNNSKLMSVFAEELENTNLMLCDLKKELNSITATKFLELWEEEYNSRECSNATTFTQRKKELVAKSIAIGGNAPHYFEYLASLVGFEIKVVDNNIFDLKTCEDDCEKAVVAEEMGFVWYIDVFGFVKKFKTCEDNCETPLDWIEGKEMLECLFEKIKPAHTILNFRYKIDFELITNDGKYITTDDDKMLVGE